MELPTGNNGSTINMDRWGDSTQIKHTDAQQEAMHGTGDCRYGREGCQNRVRWKES